MLPGVRKIVHRATAITNKAAGIAINAKNLAITSVTSSSSLIIPHLLLMSAPGRAIACLRDFRWLRPRVHQQMPGFSADESENADHDQIECGESADQRDVILQDNIFIFHRRCSFPAGAGVK